MQKVFLKFLSVLLVNDFTFRFLRMFSSKKLVILYYHSIVDDAAVINQQDSGLFIRESTFSKHIDFLKKNYNLVSENDIIDALESGKKLPDYSLWINFDDGYKDNYTRALKVLKQHKVPATIFVTSGKIAKEGYMTKDDLEEVLNAGLSIGGHTVNHPRLSKLSKAEAFNEIISGKKVLEELLSSKILSFAYPFGKGKDFNQESIESVKEAGFKMAVTTIGGFNNLNRALNPYSLKRMGASFGDDLKMLKLKLIFGACWQ